MTPEQVHDQTARSSLELLYEIGRELTAALDLRTVLHRVLFLSMKHVGATSGSIIALDEDGQPGESAFLIHGQTHRRTSLQLKVTYERGMAGWVARHQQAVLIPDTSKDKRWLRRPDDAESRTGPKSAVSAPIMAHDKLVGVITLVHPQPGFFAPDHLELARAIADQAGNAILNARLFNNSQVAHRRYLQLFEDSIDPIIITDFQGRILEANLRAMENTGLDREAIKGQSIQSLHLVDWSRVGEKFENLVSGETITFESVLSAAGKRGMPVQVYVKNIQPADQAQLQWILRDITERKDLDSLREDLIAMVYHDLRSPLANVVSSLEVLWAMFDGNDDETVTSLLGIAMRSTERIQRLTNSLLDINRLEAGQRFGEQEVAPVLDLIQEAVEAVSTTGRNTGVEIRIEAPTDLRVFADLDMIQRVLINLLENAVKFSPPGGKIIVGAQPDGNMVQIWVADTGPGIATEDQERIFNKFTRLNNNHSPRGLGLGLTFCRLAVGSYGGKIWVESKPGEGAIFRFTVPSSGLAEY